MMLDWSRFQSRATSPETAFEAFAAQLFERWLRREHGDDLASYTLHGAGGDGGVEAFARLPSGDVIGLQAKWFAGNIKASEISKIRASLDRAVGTFPALRKYVLAQRQNLTKARHEDETGGVERWENFIAAAKNHHPLVEVVRWDEAGLLDQLAQPGNQEIKALWFESEFTANMITVAWEKSRSRLGDRYLPDLHAVGSIDAILDNDLWSSQAVRQKRRALQQASESLSEASSALGGFIRLTDGRRPPELDAPAIEAAASIEALRSHASALLGVVASGPRLEFPEGPEVDALAGFDELLADFKEKDEGTYTADHAERALKLAWEAYEKVDGIEQALRASTRPRLVVGPAGCGKTHAAAAGVRRRVEGTAPCVLVLGKGSVPRDGAARILADALDTPGWSLARMLDGLEALAVLRQASLVPAEEGEVGFARALILIDGLEEAPESDRWGDLLGDLAVELARRPRVHLVATTRPEFFRHADLPRSIGHVHVEEHADVDLPAMLFNYAREYRVGIEAVPWLGWALRNALEIRLLAEEFRGRAVSAAEGANANVLTLFRRKVARLEKEARERAGDDAWTEHLGLLPVILEVLSDLTAEEGRVRVDDADIVARVMAVDTEFTARRVRVALAMLQEHGLVDRYLPPPRGLRGPQPEYSLATRHLSDFVLATRLAEMTVAALPPGDPVPFPSTLRGRDAASVLYAARLAEQGHFVVDISWLEPPTDLRVVHAKALSLLPPALAATRRDELVSWLVESTALNRALVRGLVLPVSRVPDHPLGPLALDEALRGLALAARDPVWSVPEDLDGTGPWHRCFDRILDELGLARQDPWNGPPLVAAWATSTVIEQRRQRVRAALAIWGSGRLGEMVRLLEHMSNVDDPQVLDDCVVAALGAAIGAPVDDPALPELARLMDTLFFSPEARAWTESIPVRVAARGVVERAALVHPGDFVAELERARPPYTPRGGWPAVDREEVDADGHFGGEIVTGDLSWYVAERCFRRFSEIATSAGGYWDGPIDHALLRAMDDGRLVAPSKLAEQRAAALAAREEKNQQDRASREDLFEQLRAWHKERTGTEAEELDEAGLLTWATEQPEMREAREDRQPDPAHSDEFRQLLAHVEAELGVSAPSPKSVRNGLIAQLVKSWGWSREGFLQYEWDKPPEVVDDAIGQRHGSGGRHGSRSAVCQFREKYVWAAVDRIAGALADRMPVWNRDEERWERLTNLDELGHGLPDPLPHSEHGDGGDEDPQDAWTPDGLLLDQFQDVDDLGQRAERWLTEGVHPDPTIFLAGEVERWPDAVVLGFSHWRRGHQSCVDQLVQVRAFGARPGDLDFLRRDAPFVLLEHYDRGAWTEEGVYAAPALTCWAPWYKWRGIDQGYVSFTGEGDPRDVEIRATVANVTARFEGDWPQEPDVWMLGPDLGRAFGVAGMQGGRWLRHYLDGHGEPVATERDVKPPYHTFDHHYLVTDRERLVGALEADGFVPMWIVRVLWEVTPALFMRGHKFDPRPGLVHRSRDTVWMVIGDPASGTTETIQLVDTLEPWTGNSDQDEDAEGGKE